MGIEFKIWIFPQGYCFWMGMKLLILKEDLWLASILLRYFQQLICFLIAFKAFEAQALLSCAFPATFFIVILQIYSFLLLCEILLHSDAATYKICNLISIFLSILLSCYLFHVYSCNHFRSNFWVSLPRTLIFLFQLCSDNFYLP